MEITSEEDLESLLSLLEDHTKSFEMITMTFIRKYKKSEYFRLGTTLYLLLQNYVLSIGSRLNAYYILFDLYKADPLPNNPFFPSFWLPHQTRSVSPQERAFLLLILNNMITALSKRSVNEYLKGIELPGIPNIDLRSLIKAYQIRQPQFTSAFYRVGITPSVIDDPDNEAFYHSDIEQSSTEAREEVLGKLLSSDCLELQYMRPPPPLLVPTGNEMHWLNPEEKRNPLWMEVGNMDTELIKRSLRESLPPEIVDEARQFIQNHLKLALDVITKDKLPLVIENNYLVAVELLVQLMDNNLSKSTEYLSVLFDIPISLHVLEVVNKLSTLVDLPNTFLQPFINQSIESCRNIKDKYTQSRMVRLVSVFLQHHVTKKNPVIKSLNAAIQSFCVEFSSNKEATLLFKLLKENM